MVLRVMKDELAAYEKQLKQSFQKTLENHIPLSNDEFLSQMARDTRLLPVITIVLYFGTGKPWDGKIQLYDLLDMEEELAAQQASMIEEKFMELVEQFHLKDTQIS